MESATDKEWATKYLINPLHDPEPSEDCGPGAHVGSVNNRKAPASVTTSSYPTPPSSASPSRSSFHSSNPFSPVHRQEAFSEYSPVSPPRYRRSMEASDKNPQPTRRRRGSSLTERYPGDKSHRPLDIIRKETKAANRAPHLKKQHMPGADTIDVLDNSSRIAWHHEGPYDATLLARNTNYKSSPVEALRDSNAEAIRATPRENIRDALDKHVPLQGTAVIPPGMRGLDGQIMNYEEGADLMREADAPGGAYKRWEGIEYHPDDLKGKGEPSFTIERALKGHQDRSHSHKRYSQANYDEYELQSNLLHPSTASRQRSNSGNDADLTGRSSGSAGGLSSYAEFESSMQRSNTTGRKIGMDGLKRRLGSLRLKKKTVDV